MSHHTLLHRSLRPVVRMLAATGVTPDQITGLRLLTGIAAACCLGWGERGLGAGGALFLLSGLLDRLDGSLARRIGHSSAFGWRFDLIADCVSTMGFFLGLGVGAALGTSPQAQGPASVAALTPILMGAGGACGVAALFWQLNIESPETQRVRAFDPDDLMLVMPALLWCGLQAEILLLAATVAPLAACILWWLRRPRRNPA